MCAHDGSGMLRRFWHADCFFFWGGLQREDNVKAVSTPVMVVGDGAFPLADESQVLWVTSMSAWAVGFEVLVATSAG
jgi:hypothetical protein